MLPLNFGWWFDPVYWLTMIGGYVMMLIIASTIAPKVARRLSGRFSLYVSMALLAIVLVSITAGAIWAALYYGGYATIHSVPFIIGSVVAMNLFTYIISPFIINLIYGARPDPDLQAVVDSVAARLGFGRVKAVLVDGPPNAFAYGNILTGRYVAITRSLHGMLNRNELEAVIGHELGHHIHRDNLVMLIFGMFPAVVYYLGYTLLWHSILGGRGERGGGGIAPVLVGAALVAISFIQQLLVLAFSRMREYYADYVGAMAAGRWAMQRALAKLHLFYESWQGREAKEIVEDSKIKALFIYAFTAAYANPIYDVTSDAIERIKRMEVGGLQEILSSHPPVPKRLRFLDTVEV